MNLLTATSAQRRPYAWARPGDVNAFFGLALDNVAVLVLLFTLLTAGGAFTPDFVLNHMVPGTALGVLLGDLVYTGMAFALARRTGRTDVTAMPLGLEAGRRCRLSRLDRGRRPGIADAHQFSRQYLDRHCGRSRESRRGGEAPRP